MGLMLFDHAVMEPETVHFPISFVYADATARLAATGFVTTDVMKFAYQQSDQTIWVLTDDSPITWRAISGFALAPDDPEIVEYIYFTMKEILSSTSNITTTFNDGIFSIEFSGMSTATVKTSAWTNIGNQLFSEQAGDPGAAAADKLYLYAKDDGGITALFTQDEAGTVKKIGAGAADEITYDNATSGLVATDAQAALDEIAALVALAGIEVQEGTTPVETDIDVLDFNATDFDITNPSAGVAHVALADIIAAQTIAFVIKDGAGIIVSGIKLDWIWHFAATIVQVDLMADQDTNAVLDIWEEANAGFPPTVGDSITASAKPTLTAAKFSSDSTLTGWNTSVAAGDVWRINCDSNSAATRITMAVKFTRVIN